SLQEKGLSNAVFAPEIMRGFDYYTGIVFELADTDPQNPRAVAGGGRYDDLVSLFGVDKVGGIGFGMGDVVLKDFLEIRGLLPKYESEIQVFLCALSENEVSAVACLATQFREAGIKVATNFDIKKITKQIKIAEKLGINYFMCIGEDEIKTQQYVLKNLNKREETKGTVEDLINKLKVI
ncbi:MAG: ATP phosphoribosyltransferase regulatory subunit, partial [Alphaproteobacteria bacterium]|nr:ATP phosphoribosyltransferase regulatory subunit [Alphaproteobacteria bacterium]